MGKSLSGRELGKGLSQRKDGRYQARFTDRFGKRVEYKNTNFNEVKKWMEQEKAKNSLKINCMDNTMTINDWFAQWLNIYKYGVIRNTTRTLYITHYKKTIAPALGHMRLQNVCPSHIKSLLNNMDKDGYRYNTKNIVRKILFDMFDKAVLDDLVTKNPVKPIKLKNDEEKDVRVLTRDEQELFMDCAKGTFYSNLFVVMINTGMRIGEVAALTKDDINFESNQITISKNLLYVKLEGDDKKTFHLGQPKTNRSNRTIPMNHQCKIALKKQLMQKRVVEGRSPKDVSEEFKKCIFTTKFNTPLCNQIVNDAIKKICDEINLTLDTAEQLVPFSPHCLRHTFATRCLEAGIQPKVLQQMLGHATLAMTMDLYSHVLDDFKQDSIKMLEDKMNEYDEDEFIQKRYEQYAIDTNKIIRIG